MAKIVEGNLCLFLLLRLTAAMVFAVGVVVLADGVYALIKSGSFLSYSGGVLIFGVVIVLLATVGYLNRSNPYLSLLYVSVLFLVFLALGVLTVAMIIDYKKVEDDLGGVNEANIVKYTLLCATVVALIAVLLACCYRSSLLASYLKHKYQQQGRNDSDTALMSPPPEKKEKDHTEGGPLLDMTTESTSPKGKRPILKDDKMIKHVQPGQKTGAKLQPFAFK